ncbi:MAG TPA: cobalt ECF transporter T component CbiQ [Bacillota bacterium]|nr:cobalt ECF transporter T component CbiQ [Bacillota bacterium]
MKGIEAAEHNLRYLEELALQPTLVGRVDPTVKLLTTLIFSVVVASFSRYALLELLPLVFYLLVLIILGELPVGYLMKRVMWAAPFALFVGIGNLFLDHSPVLNLNGVVITGGWISFTTIMMKFTLTVLAVLILIATTGINQIGAALYRIRLPRIWVGQLLFLYRYLFVLLEESNRMIRAYTLRSGEKRGVHAQAWGSLLGQLLLRTYDRAHRIHQAMLCRGYEGKLPVLRRSRLRLADGIFFAGWSVFFLLVRCVNLPQIMGDFWWKVVLK